MDDHVKTIRSAVLDLENIQRQIGQTQVQLLDILTDDSEDECDEPAQAALVRLERGWLERYVEHSERSCWNFVR